MILVKLLLIVRKNMAINYGYFHTQRGDLKRLINDTAYNALNRKRPDAMEDNINIG